MPGTTRPETVTNRPKSHNGLWKKKNCPVFVFDRSGKPSAVHAGACTGNAGARARGRVGVRVRGHAGARPPASAPATWARDRQGVRVRGHAGARSPAGGWRSAYPKSDLQRAVCAGFQLLCPRPRRVAASWLLSSRMTMYGRISIICRFLQ